MRRDARAPPRSLRLLSQLLVLYSFINTACSKYGVPIEIQLWDTGKSPLAHMVDVTNEFGLKVLANHNFLNDNNIAFSPYGLTGIMVALYEGVDGESSYQIQRGMQMPWNRNIMRIGFRDIHRTLKTYFVPEEGFLAGLALNNENVTFNMNYKKILRFYGFDLEKDHHPNMPPHSSTVSTTIDVPSITTIMSETPALQETTPNPSAETLADVNIRIPTTTAASSAVSAENGTTMVASTAAPSTITQGTTFSETFASTETTVIEVETDTMPGSQGTTPAELTTMSLTTLDDTVVTETIAATNSDTNTTPTSSAEITLSSKTETLTTNSKTEIQMTTENSKTVMTTENSNAEITTMNGLTETATVAVTNTTEQLSPSTNVPTTIQDMTTTTSIPPATNDTTLETLQRRKKSVVDFIFTSPPFVDDYLIYRSYNIPTVPQPTFDGSDNWFLANGFKSIQVSYMQYDTILEHAYLPHLEASALRLPLDSERYYLLVVLPSRGGPTELGRLIARMARESDLRDIHGALRPRRVKAIVPSFTVKGHVTLTTDLQKLGIQDVFEPRQRDFSPMTSQANVYVRSIEQAVSVAIRKYRADDNQKLNRYVANKQPVQFSATYPFVYFVMDASIHVALMAGKMVDPLNTRIL